MKNLRSLPGIKSSLHVSQAWYAFLKHSFALQLLEKGTDLKYIQELLGHGSAKTTETYTHRSKKIFANIKSPLDQLIEEQNTDNKIFTPIKS